jgi:hypothetical protein
VITHLSEIRSFWNDRLFAAADFEFISLGIFEEQGVVAGTVTRANFRPFQISAAGLSHDFCKLIDFLSRLCPKGNSRTIWAVFSILREHEEFGRLVASGRVKCSPSLIGPVAGEAERREILP